MPIETVLARVVVDDLSRALLVVGVRVTVQEAHGDRLSASLGGVVQHRKEGLRFEVDCHLSIGQRALGDAVATRARDERSRHGSPVVIDVRASAAPQGDRIAQPLGAEQGDGAATAGEQRVGGDRGAVDEQRDLTPSSAQAVQDGINPTHHGADLISGDVQLFVRDQLVIAGAGDQVGERAPHVNRDRDAHRLSAPRASGPARGRGTGCSTAVR